MQALNIIRRSEVPAYLQESELYLSLDDENDDEISVPSNCLKSDTTVSSLTELDHFLSTVSFWITSPLTMELMSFVADRRVPGVKAMVAQYRVNYPTMFLVVTELYRSRSKFACHIAAKHGCIAFLKYFADRKKPLSSYTLRMAAENGHVGCLAYCLEHLTRNKHKVDLDRLDWNDVVKAGHVNCLRFLVEHGLRYTFNYCLTAASYGELAGLKYLLSVCPDQSRSLLALAALQHDHVDCLKLIMEPKERFEITLPMWETAMSPGTNSHSINDCSSNEKMFYRCCLLYLLDTVSHTYVTFPLVELACKFDKVVVIRLLRQRGFQVNVSALVYASQNGKTECFQYMLTECRSDLWVHTTMAAAASTGQLELVKQLHERGCPWDESATIAALKANHSECLEYLLNQRGVPTSDAFTSIEPSMYCSIIIRMYQCEQLSKELEKRLDRTAAAMRENEQEWKTFIDHTATTLAEIRSSISGRRLMSAASLL